MVALSPLFFYAFVAIGIVNISYFAYFSIFPFRPQRSIHTNSEEESISVIVCAQNEINNLRTLIPKLLEQDFSVFEILIVNDHSTDGSLELLREFDQKHHNFNFLNLTEQTGKKAGITAAVSLAQYNRLVFTDADCIPASKDWLRAIHSAFTPNAEIVLGYGAYLKLKSSFLNKLIRFETLLTALQYFGHALRKNTYMGVGRNLAYTKTLFNTSGGFESHKHVKPGDDDLFVNQNATPTNVALCINPEAFTISQPKTTWKSWFIQKRRHVGVAHLYQAKHQVQLALFYCSQVLFFLFFLGAALTATAHFYIILCLFVMRELYVWSIYATTAKKLQERDLIPFILLLEPFLVSLQMLIFISNSLVKPRRWK